MCTHTYPHTHPPHSPFIFYFLTNCQHPETEFITVCCPGMCYKQLHFVDALKNITSNPQVAASQKRSSQFRDSYIKSKTTNSSTPVFSSSMVLDLRFTQATTKEENNKGKDIFISGWSYSTSCVVRVVFLFVMLMTTFTH